MTSSDSTTEVSKLVESICKTLAYEPDQIQIEPRHAHGRIVLNLHCSKKDVGVFIGKRGMTITALRHLTTSIGARRGIKVDLDIIEEYHD